MTKEPQPRGTSALSFGPNGSGSIEGKKARQPPTAPHHAVFKSRSRDTIILLYFLQCLTPRIFPSDTLPCSLVCSLSRCALGRSFFSFFTETCIGKQVSLSLPLFPTGGFLAAIFLLDGLDTRERSDNPLTNSRRSCYPTARTLAQMIPQLTKVGPSALQLFNP